MKTREASVNEKDDPTVTRRPMPDFAESETGAFDQGKRDRRSGLPKTANPYPGPRDHLGRGADGTLLGSFWLDGWEHEDRHRRFRERS